MASPAFKFFAKHAVKDRGRISRIQLQLGILLLVCSMLHVGAVSVRTCLKP